MDCIDVQLDLCTCVFIVQLVGLDRCRHAEKLLKKRIRTALQLSEQLKPIHIVLSHLHKLKVKKPAHLKDYRCPFFKTNDTFNILEVSVFLKKPAPIPNRAEPASRAPALSTRPQLPPPPLSFSLSHASLFLSHFSLSLCLSFATAVEGRQRWIRHRRWQCGSCWLQRAPLRQIRREDRRRAHHGTRGC